jgi:putative FmdB family regulatory protein
MGRNVLCDSKLTILLGERILLPVLIFRDPSLVPEVGMPHYEYFCHACKKIFSKILTFAEYEKGNVACPHCGKKNVEQKVTAFYAVTSKKSA